jgi:nitrite reductase/ring-hydroxylating ferredoxin subunit
VSEFVKVARVGDVKEGAGLCVEAGGQRIGLFRVDGEVYAIDDMCSHADASLCDGSVSGDEVVCPLHAATFNIRTGEATGPPAYEPVRTYQVRIEGEDIEVQVGD